MKIVLHILRKDLRRMRGWLIAWLGVLALPLLMAAWWPVDVHDDRGWTRLAEMNRVVLGLQVLLAYVLVLVLMQEDPAVGTRQAWVTRPIARWRMLAAKTLAAVVMVGGIAALVGVPWWVWCGFGAAEIGRAAGEQVLIGALVVVPAMFMGTVTDSLSRAFLWSLVLLAIATVWSMPLILGARIPATFVAIMTMWLLEAMVVIAAVFLLRRRGWAVAAGLAAMVLSWLVGFWVPWERLARAEPRELRPELGAGVAATFHEAWTQPVRSTRKGLPAMAHLRVTFGVTAPESDRQLVGVGAQQSWRWPGVEFEREGGLVALAARTVLPGFEGPKFEEPEPDPETEAWIAARRAERAKMSKRKTRAWQRQTPPKNGILMQAYALVPASIAARMAAEASTYEAQLWLGWVRSTVRNEGPLRSGTERTGEAHRLAIRRVERSEKETRVDVTDFVARSWIRDVIKAAGGRPWFTERSAAGYVLLNRERKEARMISSVRRRALYVHGVEIGSWELKVPADRVRRGDGWMERPEWREWIDGASLAFSETRVESMFARRVKVEGFQAVRWEDE